jgi:hypothetical protein
MNRILTVPRAMDEMRRLLSKYPGGFDDYMEST